MNITNIINISHFHARYREIEVERTPNAAVVLLENT